MKKRFAKVALSAGVDKEKTIKYALKFRKWHDKGISWHFVTKKITQFVQAGRKA